MNIPTCYRCPMRNVDGVRCEILQGKLDAVKGAGLSSFKFRCEKRPSLFRPGDVVEFGIYSHEHYAEEEGNGPLSCVGIVMRPGQRKVLVYVDDDRGDATERPIINLWQDRIAKTGEHHPVCVHCQKPEGKGLSVVRKLKDEPGEWVCRDGEGMVPLPCEFPEPAPDKPEEVW